MSTIKPLAITLLVGLSFSAAVSRAQLNFSSSPGSSIQFNGAPAKPFYATKADAQWGLEQLSNRLVQVTAEKNALVAQYAVAVQRMDLAVKAGSMSIFQERSAICEQQMNLQFCDVDIANTELQMKYIRQRYLTIQKAESATTNLMERPGADWGLVTDLTFERTSR